MKQLTYFVISLLLAPFSAIWQGYVFAKLWLWFAVSQFSLPPIGIAASIGVMCLIGMGAHQIPAYKKDEEGTAEDRFFYSLACAIVGPLFWLAIGAIAKQFLA